MGSALRLAFQRSFVPCPFSGFANGEYCTVLYLLLCHAFQADLLGCSVVRPESIETTALGAALAAGLAVGLWDEESVFSRAHDDEKLGGGTKAFEPTMGSQERADRFASWCKAVERSYGLADLV